MAQNQEINNSEIYTPITTPFLIGHLDAEKEFLDAFKSGNLHHSWIISGEKGIGKATLAYRIIRYIFSLQNQDLISDLSLDTNLDLNKVEENSLTFDEEDDGEDDDFSFSSSDLIVPDSNEKKSDTKDSLLQSIDSSPLKLSPKNPIFERLVAGGITDFKIVEREYSDASKTKLKSEISVEQIRDLKEFFSKTSSEGGYKIALIDSVDDMNSNSSNALLKILEEAPNKSLLILICNNFEGLLDTIKSRCRVLKLHPLSDENMELLLHEYLGDVSDENIKKLLPLARGSIGTALNFYNNNGLEILNTFYSIIPNVLTKKNKSILDIITLVGNSEIKLKIFEQVYLTFLENIIKLSAGLDVNFASETEEKTTKLCANYLTNFDKIYKIREDLLNYFELVPVLNLDYMATIISSFERLKNAY
ncbi:MAG: hypothetical protein K6F04_02555 [bacterium]|nr:hypothetical protein [bacterium]